MQHQRGLEPAHIDCDEVKVVGVHGFIVRTNGFAVNRL